MIYTTGNLLTLPLSRTQVQAHALLCATTEAALSSARCHNFESQSMQEAPQTYSKVCVVEYHTVKGHAV